jgi:23S rRNA (guanosine2251-2'-O)-methyltransferase
MFGRNPIIEALRASRPIHKIWVADGSKTPAELLDLARERAVPVSFVKRGKIDALAEGEVHQGVAASIAPVPYADLDDIVPRNPDPERPAFVVLLDSVQDPHNLGSVIRTADATGAHGVVVPRHRAAGLTGTLAKTSAGAISHVPVARVGNLSQSLDVMKERGLWFVAADAEGDRDYREVDYTGALGLVVGGEDRGVGRLLGERCDFRVRLPRVGRVNSLNASVAAAVLMYEVFRQRHPL